MCPLSNARTDFYLIVSLVDVLVVSMPVPPNPPRPLPSFTLPRKNDVSTASEDEETKSIPALARPIILVCDSI